MNQNRPNDGPNAANPQPDRPNLAAVPPESLDEALGRPDLQEQELLQLLRNRRATTSQLQRIGARPSWLRSHAVKRGLVQHPRCPLPLGRRLLPHLYWQELAMACEDLRLHPVLRRQAEELLKVRAPELTLGERITLARRATPPVIAVLAEGSDPPVLQSLMGNPRLLEPEAVLIARRERTPVESLGRLARHPRWGACRAVRMALTQNPRTPAQVALELLRRLSPNDLRQVAKDDKVPKLIRIGADRVLAEGSARRSPGWGR